ncbi:MAG: tetratricopeptide repeat protein [Bacteroidia bacterium]
MKRFILIILLLFTLLPVLKSQTDNKNKVAIDSILAILKTEKTDTLIVKNLNLLSRYYMDIGDFSQAIQYALQAKEKGTKCNYKHGVVAACNNVAAAYSFRGDYVLSINSYIEALKISEKIHFERGVANAYNGMGTIYLNQKKYDLALENYEKSLEIRKRINDVKGIAACYNNIGVIYKNQGKQDDALNSYLKCLHTLEEDAKRSGQKYHQGISSSYNNIGLIYLQKKEYEKALDNLNKALEIRTEAGDKLTTASTCNNIAKVYIMQDKFNEALKYLERALRLNKAIKARASMQETYSYMAELYEKQGDFQRAFEFHALYSDTKDSLLNEQSSKQIAEMNAKYDSEKKDKELLKKDAEINRQLAETEKRNLQRNVFVVGFCLVLLLALFIFRSYRQKKIANFQLNEKSELIAKQKGMVEEKNKKITDSINYAKRIQHAIIPSKESFLQLFKDSFILFRPKDIVSGDFYWFTDIAAIENKDSASDVLLACVDCTGHGVPGALMSMMGYNLLEQVVKEHRIYQPSLVLDELDKIVLKSLYQKGEQGILKDAMDISLARIDRDNMVLHYAGAHTPLFLIRNGVLTELRGDKRTVGSSVKVGQPFINHTMRIEHGDCIYIFSDGFVDQKGGSEPSKFFLKPFKELLLSIHREGMQAQLSLLEDAFVKWKKDYDQTDDVLVIGIRI